MRLTSAFICLLTLLSFGLVTAAQAQSGQTPSFYVAAHPDDIQLFIGNQAAADASSSSVRTVWIIVTAGDAGRDTNWWQAREAGALASMERAAGFVPGAFPSGCYHTTDKPTINGHTVVRHKLIDGSANVRSVMYLLRLPDGNVDGSGFASASYESLLKLMNSTISTIHAVDGLATYTGISDVMYTLDAIMTSERNATNPSVHPWLNANEYSGMRNTNDSTEDHTDHRVLGSVLASFAYYNGYNRLWWKSYTVQSDPNKTVLSGSDYTNKVNLFEAYTAAMETMLDFFNGQTPPSGHNWTWSGSTDELTDHDGWWAHFFEFCPVMRVYTTTYSTADANNHYPLTYP